MKFIAVIPARYASSRFPAKPLALLAGVPVIQRVYSRVAAVVPTVYVATDDERIYNKVTFFGGKAIMTSPNHKSGTDRIAEAICKINGDYDVVLNIQGDEPFIQKSQIQTLCECFANDTTQIATLGKRFTSISEIENPNSPKIITDNRGYAMYFSRSVIPYIRGVERDKWVAEYPFLKHVGVYAYRTNVLREITKLPQSSLEIAESLEQLRWLQNGYCIQVALTDTETIGIDTPDDLLKAEEFMRKNSL